MVVLAHIYVNKITVVSITLGWIGCSLVGCDRIECNSIGRCYVVYSYFGVQSTVHNLLIDWVSQ